MAKSSLLTTAALAAICSTVTIVEAFSTCQSSSRINALSAPITSKCASTTPIHSTTTTRLNMSNQLRHNNHRRRNNNNSSLFPIKASSQQLASTLTALIQRLRKSFAILVASLTILLSTASSSHFVPHAHAASSTAVTTTTTAVTKSWIQKLNPLRTKSANELIDEYVRDRLFADDAYDPVESAYREAYADYATSSSGAAEGSMGSYPTLLAETASSALGRKQDFNSLVSSSKTTGGTTSSSSGLDQAKKDGITSLLIKSSDFLQRRLRVSASISYYIIAATSILSLCVLPGTLGVLYQGIQRLQIDKSEMKMYGKISDMDATVKRVSDDDEEEEEEEDDE